MLGGEEFIQFFRIKLGNDISTKFKSFKQANEDKENGFKVRRQMNELQMRKSNEFIETGFSKGEHASAVHGLLEALYRFGAKLAAQR